jgi:hypothetical protein
LTAPINPGSVLFLLQSGYPADVVFDLTVESINLALADTGAKESLPVITIQAN